VSHSNAWLDDVHPSPYAEQLALGFRALRFELPLEREYRAYLLEDSVELRRIALSVAMVLWLAFAALDFVVVQGPPVWWMLVVRLSVFGLLAICAWLIFKRDFLRLTLPLSLLCILALGVGAALVVGIAHRADPAYPYEGLLLISMGAYFLIGLRLVEAASCALLVCLAYVAAEVWAVLPTTQLVNNALFLLFSNLIGAVGCYLLEFKSREHFLVSRLMQVLADSDSLTGLHNRRSFNRQFDRLWRQAQREGRPLALLLCDIDHFKAYNDCYGHQAGDAVLQQVAGLLQAVGRRPLDMAVRLGGEEFAVLLYDICPKEAAKRAEVLRVSLELLDIRHERSDTASMLTMSIGVACIQPGGEGRFAHLYEHADRALYEAKASGRNQVVA
jgi:diguanylate cyclase (GGDEF)-like protein